MKRKVSLNKDRASRGAPGQGRTFILSCLNENRFKTGRGSSFMKGFHVGKKPEASSQSEQNLRGNGPESSMFQIKRMAIGERGGGNAELMEKLRV